MGISSSLNASVAGLNVNASKLATISDNIANSGTNGYKRSVVDFASVVTADTGGSYNAGGVRVTSGKDVDQQGSLINSTSATDIAIAGSGFLPVTPVESRDEPGATRPLQLVTTGSFETDDEGYLRTSSGLQLLGWRTDSTGAHTNSVIRSSGASLVPVQISGVDFASNPTSQIDLGVNLPSTETGAGASAVFTEDVLYYDGLGAEQTVTLTFTATTTANQWTLQITDNSTTPAGDMGTHTLVFDGSTGTAPGKLQTVTEDAGNTAQQQYDDNTGFINIPTSGGDISLNIGLESNHPSFNAAAAPMSQLAAEYAPTAILSNGTPADGLNRVEFTEDGFLEAIYDSGYRQKIYQVPIADVTNADGLISVGNQAFELSANSGPMYLWDAGEGPTGTVIGFAVEQSTVDIAQELTQLIETQRAYSSNASVVQAVDEILQETTNLTR